MESKRGRGFSSETATKYAELLKILIKKLNNQENEPVNITEFFRINHVSPSFVNVVKKLGYIKQKNDSGKTTLIKDCYSDMNPAYVSLRDGRNIQKMMTDYNTRNRDYNKNKTKKLVEVDQIKKIQENISNVLDLEKIDLGLILKELKRRGFEGELNRIETVNI